MKNMPPAAVQIRELAGDIDQINQKLRESVYQWIKDCTALLAETPVPERFGWSFSRAVQKGSTVAFKFGSEHHQVTTGWQAQPMSTVVILCEALAGDEGKAFLEWLQQELARRQDLLANMQTIPPQAAEG